MGGCGRGVGEGVEGAGVVEGRRRGRVGWGALEANPASRH